MFGLHSILETYGVLAILLIIFCETAIPVCFFLPGDTLLFTAGILASIGKLGFLSVVVVAFLAALLGGVAGFSIGKSLGARFLDDEKISPKLREIKQRTQLFYMRYGAYAVVIGRFIPLVRTCMSSLAGASGMGRRLFYGANALGALLWTVSIPTIGFFLGRRFPHLADYMVYAVIVVVILSFIPVVFHVVSAWRKKRNA